MLTLAGIEAGYGAAPVLFGIDLVVPEGAAVALLGRNGMGKTTTVRVIMGLLPARRGRVRFRGQDLTGARPHRIARAGIGLVPEGRQVFPSLTVEENLVATAAARHGPARWTLPRIYALFPRLAERRRHRGAELSGGEQQMLAIGRALMTNPSLLILDEATEGLAPLVRAEIFACLALLRREGESILVIDKHLAALRRLAGHAAILETGRVAWSGPMAALTPGVVERHLHI